MYIINMHRNVSNLKEIHMNQVYYIIFMFMFIASIIYGSNTIAKSIDNMTDELVSVSDDNQSPFNLTFNCQASGDKKHAA